MKIEEKRVIDPRDFIAVDIGNSRIKLLYSDEMTSIDIKEGWQVLFNNYLKGVFQLAKGSLTKDSLTQESLSIYSLNVCVSSVNDRVEKELRGILDWVNDPSFHFQVVNTNDVLDTQKIVDFSLVSGMGSDRKLGLIGALDYIKAPLITVDIGTAVTINTLDKYCICRGGVIFPGPYTQVKSLAERTSGLAGITGLGEVDMCVAAEINGLDTLTAMSNGIIYGVCGSIKEIIRLIKFQNPEMVKAKIIMTGGGAELIKWVLKTWVNDPLDFNFRYEEDLVLRGILKIIRN